MKYLKTFENKNDELWVVYQLSTMGPQLESLDIFDDEQSAVNYFIDLVNDLARENAYQNGDITREEADETDYIFTVEDANEYLDNSGEQVHYTRYYNNGTYELPENLKIGRDSKKYNL